MIARIPLQPFNCSCGSVIVSGLPCSLHPRQKVGPGDMMMCATCTQLYRFDNEIVPQPVADESMLEPTLLRLVAEWRRHIGEGRRRAGPRA